MSITVSLRRSIAKPVLRTFAHESGADLDLRFVERTQELTQELADDFDVVWSSDPAAIFALARAGVLAPLPESALASRAVGFADEHRRWAAVTADLRVIAYDPKRVNEDSLPTHFEDLVHPEWASKVSLAQPTLSPSSLWHAAALYAAKGAAPTNAFYRDLSAAGAEFVASERDVLKAVAGAGRPIGVLDGEIAFAGRELGRGIGILIPDQDGGGVVLRATMVGLHKRAAQSKRALSVIEYLLSVPVTRRLALLSGHIATLPNEVTSAGGLSLSDLKTFGYSQEDIAAQVAKAASALADLH